MVEHPQNAEQQQAVVDIFLAEIERCHLPEPKVFRTLDGAILAWTSTEADMALEFEGSTISWSLVERKHDFEGTVVKTDFDHGTVPAEESDQLLARFFGSRSGCA